MTDPLITEYLPMVKAMVARRYASMGRRGNCLLTVDDLVQIASIELMHLTSEWDQILAGMGKTRDGNGGMFWRFLEKRVRDAVIKYYDKVAHAKRAASSSIDDIEANPDHYSIEARTALARLQQPSIVHHDIAGFFDTLPRKDKVYIALRYFDELSYAQIADLLGAHKNTTINLTRRIVDRWRDFARNQFTDHSVVVGRRVEWEWEPTETLLTYIQNRHRVDLPEYLGWVSLCLRADVSYLADILSTQRTEAVSAREPALSPFQQAEVDRLIGEGVNKMEISRRLGVTYGVVIGHAKRRIAA